MYFNDLYYQRSCIDTNYPRGEVRYILSYLDPCVWEKTRNTHMPFFIKAAQKHSLPLYLTWDCSGSSRRLGLDRADRRPFISERLWLLSSSSVRSCSSSPPMSSRLGCDCAIWKARRRLETDIHLKFIYTFDPPPFTEIFPKVEVMVLKASPSFPVAALLSEYRQSHSFSPVSVQFHLFFTLVVYS